MVSRESSSEVKIQSKVGLPLPRHLFFNKLHQKSRTQASASPKVISSLSDMTVPKAHLPLPRKGGAGERMRSHLPLPRMGGKGQEGAPFELLVAVIVMGFVIFIGLQAMNQLAEEQCFATIDKSLEDFKIAIEIAVTQKTPQKHFFKLSNCFNPQEEEVRIQDWDNAIFCAELCGTAEITCTSVEYFNNSSGRVRSVRKCLNISPETVFPPDANPGKCVDAPDLRTQFEQDFILQNFKSFVTQGNYLLINKTLATDTFPTVCAYLRASS